MESNMKRPLPEYPKEDDPLENAEKIIGAMPGYKEIECRKIEMMSDFCETIKKKSPKLCEEFRELELAIFNEEMEFSTNMYRQGFLDAWELANK